MNSLLIYYQQGFIAQLVKHLPVIAEVMGSNPVEASQFVLGNCYSCFIAVRITFTGMNDNYTNNNRIQTCILQVSYCFFSITDCLGDVATGAAATAGTSLAPSVLLPNCKKGDIQEPYVLINRARPAPGNPAVQQTEQSKNLR